MTTITVSSGVMRTGLSIAGGTTLIVLSGGTAVGDVVLSGGIAIAQNNGWLQSTTFDGGTGLNGASGFAQSEVVENGGVLTVQSGGTADLVTVSSGGSMTVAAGGVVTGTTVGAQGTVSVLGLDNGGTVLNGGVEIVAAGGTSEATLVNLGGTETVHSGGLAVVSSGQVDHGLTASGGTIAVSSGGTTSGAVLLAGGQEVVSSNGSALAPTISGGGTLDLLPGAVVGGEILFAGGNATLIIGDTTPPVVPIGGFVAGDTLDLTQLLFFGTTSVGFDTATDVLTVTEGGTQASVQLAPGNYSGVTWSAQADAGGGTQIVACFAAGTRLATPAGPVAVQALRPGDHVVALSGRLARVRWLGHRRIHLARHPLAHEVMPVRVREGAFADNVPSHDLLLSPDHAVFVAGALVPVRHLINGVSILQESRAAVTYWHVELDRHDAVLAEGLACETYLDTGNRDAFENAAPAVQLHPVFGHGADAMDAWHERGCAAILTDPAQPVLRVLHLRLLARGLRVAQVPSSSAHSK